jgi:CobQ-like glutamine amidotransferase family enzyme
MLEQLDDVDDIVQQVHDLTRVGKAGSRAHKLHPSEELLEKAHSLSTRAEQGVTELHLETAYELLARVYTMASKTPKADVDVRERLHAAAQLLQVSNSK